MKTDHLMDTQTHKILDFLEHLWPYISGMAVTLLAGVRLWWYDRRATKRRIQHLEVLAENMVTHEQLHQCREEVRKVDDANLDKLSGEIKQLIGENAEQHQDIMRQILRLHSK